MKKTALLILVQVVLLGFIQNTAYSQVDNYKIIKSSKKKAPRWVGKWDFGKSFKLVKSKNKGVNEGLKFLFKAEEVLRKDPPYNKSLTGARAKAKANGQLAQAIASIYEEKIELNDSIYETLDEATRTEITSNIQSFKSKSQISGYVEVASYWEYVQEKETGQKYWSVYKLYSLDAEKLREVVDRMSKALGLPEIIIQEVAEVASTPSTPSDDIDPDLGFAF